MRKSTVPFLGLVVLLELFGASSGVAGTPPPLPEEPGMAVYSRSPVTVYHAAEDAGMARAVTGRALAVHRRIMTDLGLHFPVETTILLATSRLPDGTFRDMERRMAPWLAGTAYTGRQFIILRVRPGQTALDHDALLAHELTHVILRKGFPLSGTWPLWFHEGLAMRESKGEGLRHYTSLSVASLRRRLLPLDLLWSSFPDNEADSRLAYAQSFSVISFLIDRYGHSRFQEFMNVLRTARFEEAYRAVYGTGLGAMEKEWRRFAQRRYSWIPLLTGGTAFWTLILALFFLSLAARRRKDRLLMEKWEEEEREEMFG